nr:hypothetical protein [Serinicoccus sp. CNJ-927]
MDDHLPDAAAVTRVTGMDAALADEVLPRDRGLRTLVDAVAGMSSGPALPPGLVVTLTKVTSTDQVEAMVAACARIEQALGLAEGALGFSRSRSRPRRRSLGADGRATVARFVHAAAGR